MTDMAKATKSHHVVPALGGGWVVRREGSYRASRRFASKEAAEIWGRTQSIKDRSQLVIHHRDGTVAQKVFYGKDPQPPRERKK